MTAPERWRDGLVEDGDEPVVRLCSWSGPWAEDDPDANLKVDVAAYSQAGPLTTLTNLARSVDVPVGALARYVLARWASGGSEGLLQLGPSTVERMRAEVDQAEEQGTDAARLRAYEVLRQKVSWLAHGLDHPEQSYPAGGGGPVRRIRLAAYGVIDDGERVLLTRVAAGHPGAGRWTLPGGGLDHGEDPRDGARREIHEETGLPATIGELLDVDAGRFPPGSRVTGGDDVHSVRLLFRAQVPTDVSPRVVEVDGSTDEVRWVHVDELDHLDLVGLARRGAELSGLRAPGDGRWPGSWSGSADQAEA
jgi:8-oxo-dGTP pyrophosphatase MutT (NUDIX family)